MKKIMSILAVLALSVAVVGCTQKETTTETNKDAFKVGFVTDIGGIDDKSFNQGTYEGIEKFVAEDASNRTSKFLQSNAAADYEPNIEILAKDGANLVVAAGFLFEKSIETAAKANPNTNFLLIDQVVKQPNVVSAMFAEDEGAFLAGYAAALTAKEAGETKLGFIGGMESDVITRFETGFLAGVKFADPKLEVAVEYAGAFDNDAKGKTIANKMYSDGVYIIHVAAGSTGNGVIAAAKELTEKGTEKWVVGVDRDQYEDGIYGDKKDKSVILTSVVKGVDVASYEVSKLALDGNFPGGTTMKFDIKSGGVGIPDTNPNLTKDVISATDKIEAEIKAGTIVVQDKIKELAK